MKINQKNALASFLYLSIISAFIFICTTISSVASENEKFPSKDIETSVQKELKLLILEAEAGDPNAQYRVGTHYDYGWGVKKNGWEAERWYKKAAKQGFIEAQVALAILYSCILRNEKEAFLWYLKAAQNGEAFAQAMVGDAYKKGKVVPRNYLVATNWYQRAIKGGYYHAPNSLAQLYADGKGVKKDLVQAYAWNTLSASTGNIMALNFQEELETQMNQKEINQAQKTAVTLYKQYGKKIK